MKSETKKATREAFGEALAAVMEKNRKVVALTADLGESLRMLKIREKFGERFVDVGVAEANMTGIAAGLAIRGYKPVAGAFASFLPRAFDHIRVQICQNNLNVVVVGSHGGVSNAADGATAQALEDIAFMRALPNMTVVFPADYNEMKSALPKVVEHEGPVYLRLYREPTGIVTDEEDPFEFGKVRELRQGSDVTIISTGPSIMEALLAADLLKKKNLSCDVLSVSTLSSLSADKIISSAKKTGRVITLEDHNINGGLGSLVAEILCENCPASLKRLGATSFGESGDYTALTAKMGISAENVVSAARFLLKK